MSVLSIINYNKNSKVGISQLTYISKVHPYKMCYILNLCLCSGLYLSVYTISKTSLFIFIMYIISNNYYLIVLFLLFVFYPLVFIILIHPIIINTISHNIYTKSLSLGINVNNMIIFFITFLIIINIYILVYIVVYPLIVFVSNTLCFFLAI